MNRLAKAKPSFGGFSEMFRPFVDNKKNRKSFNIYNELLCRCHSRVNTDGP